MKEETKQVIFKVLMMGFLIGWFIGTLIGWSFIKVNAEEIQLSKLNILKEEPVIDKELIKRKEEIEKIILDNAVKNSEKRINFLLKIKNEKNEKSSN